MSNIEASKISRILDIYTKLIDGKVVSKQEIADRYGVSNRSVQRDFEDIRLFLNNQSVENGYEDELIYDYQSKGYKLEYVERMKFSNAEILAVSKILLGCRAFTKDKIKEILDKLVGSCVPEVNKQIVGDMLRNEMYHYIPPRHNSEFLDKLWILAQAIDGTRIIEIQYQRLKDKALKTRRIEPLAIMFSEMYFYLCGYIEDIDKQQEFDNSDDPYPTIYRIDRFKKINVTDERYKIPYRSRFEEGEFRKRIQFMQGGKLRRIKFIYSGLSVESVLDRLPTAKILSEDDGKYIIQAEVFGDGVDRWIKSQGDDISILT